MDWMEITVSTTHEAAEAVGGLLMCCGVTGWATEDKTDLDRFLEDNTELWDYVDDSLRDGTDEVLIKVYLPDDINAAETLALIREAAVRFRNEETELETGSMAVSTGTVNQQDWENNWKKYFKPVEIGERLAVCPSWETYTGTDRKIIKIDPGCAFGTGTHATTRLCLTLLDSLCHGGRVLDVGTGSGILAVSAVLLGAQSVLGTDIDESSVAVALATAEANGVSDKCTFIKTDLIKGIDGKYGIITANIVADIIIRLLPDIPRLMEENGTFIASGIIDVRETEVISAAIKQGFTAETVLRSEGWTAVAFKRQLQSASIDNL